MEEGLHFRWKGWDTQSLGVECGSKRIGHGRDVRRGANGLLNSSQLAALARDPHPLADASGRELPDANAQRTKSTAGHPRADKSGRTSSFWAKKDGLVPTYPLEAVSVTRGGYWSEIGDPVYRVWLRGRRRCGG